jgi:hypothetical protein
MAAESKSTVVYGLGSFKDRIDGFLERAMDGEREDN